MKKIFALFFVALCIAPVSLPASAADNEIKIINQDGTVSVFDLPSDEDAMRVSPSPVEEAPASVAAPQKEIAKEIKPAAHPENAVPSKPEKKVTKVQPKLPRASSAKAAVASQQRVITPYPGPRKPSMPLVKKAKINKSPVPASRGEGEPIPRNEAVSIAIRNAPPASNFKVRQIIHNDRPVYAVLFETERGDSEILIDAFTGNVVRK